MTRAASLTSAMFDIVNCSPCCVLCAQKFQVHRDQVVESLRSNVQSDQIVILYRLMYEFKHAAGLSSSLAAVLA